MYRKLQDTHERNHRQHKQMERYSMLLGWRNQYCENDYTIKHSLQIQCDPYQMAFFTELEQKNFTICIETQKTPSSQSNLEKVE